MNVSSTCVITHNSWKMKEIKQLVALLTMNSSVVYEYTASGIKRIDNGTKYERFISPSLSDSVTFIVTASLADIILTRFNKKLGFVHLRVQFIVILIYNKNFLHAVLFS